MTIEPYNALIKRRALLPVHLNDLLVVGVSMWKVIEEYDKLKKKPDFCIFFVEEAAKDRSYANLMACISETRRMGTRRVTHYMNVGRPDS